MMKDEIRKKKMAFGGAGIVVLLKQLNQSMHNNYCDVIGVYYASSRIRLQNFRFLDNFPFNFDESFSSNAKNASTVDCYVKELKLYRVSQSNEHS